MRSDNPAFTKERLEVAEVYERRRKNKRIFEERIVKPALEDAANGRPIHVQGYLEDIRRKDIVGTDGSDFKVNNNHSSIIARILWTEHPEVRGRLKLRKSEKYDSLFGIKSDLWGVVDG